VWELRETCATGCGNGACIGRCETGNKRCNAAGTALETCQGDGSWSAEACQGGCDFALKACKVCQNTPEDCFNGLDDDCDGKTDCADVDCPGHAVCVGSTGFTPGVVVAADASCPSGFAADDAVLLEAPFQVSCGGCTCAPGKTFCQTPAITIYATAAACEANQPVDRIPLTSVCTAVSGNLMVGGYRFDSDSNAACNISGAATANAPVWSGRLHFCQARQTGKGCVDGQVCAPVAGNGVCLKAAGDVACPAGLHKRTVYTGFEDTRRCTCSCRPSGGYCGLTLNTGYDDPTCGGAGLGAGAASCEAAAGKLYAKVSGMSVPPTGCEIDYFNDGRLTPSGASTLCCL
jgi:hypothetical protein